MKVHKNAKLTPAGRAELVRRVVEFKQPPAEVAAALGVSLRTAHKWLARWRAEGGAGLFDRSSRPHRQPQAPSPALLAEIVRLRRLRWTAKRIGQAVGRDTSTIARHLQRRGLAKLTDLDPPEPALRYNRACAGELLHLDIKKLGRIERIGHRITSSRVHRYRGAGWEFTHVAIDDASRVAYAEVLPDEGRENASAFLERTLAWFHSLGVQVQRVMTDNGSAYRSRTFATACRRLGVKHIFTRPYRPRTNGEAERFIQTALREWAYERPYSTSAQRTGRLPDWMHLYNWHRPHTSIGGQAPISKLQLGTSNLLQLHT